MVIIGMATVARVCPALRSELVLNVAGPLGLWVTGSCLISCSVKKSKAPEGLETVKTTNKLFGRVFNAGRRGKRIVLNTKCKMNIGQKLLLC